MMKKVFTVVIAVLMCASVVFAQAAAEENPTISVWVSGAGSQVEVLKVACEDFTAETGIKVEFSAPGDTYEEMMKTKMASNDLPDVFDTHGWAVVRYSDYLMPVNDMAFYKNISSQIIPTVSKDGKTYVLPFDMDLTGIVYNVDVMNEAGVDVDKIKTWADFEAACEKIKAIGKTPVTLGGSSGVTVGWYYDRVAPSFYYTDETNSKAADLKSGKFDPKPWEEISAMLDRWVSKGYLNADCVTGDFMGDITAISTAKAGFDFIQNVAITMGRANVNPDGNMGMMPIPSKSASDEPSLISGEGVALGIWKDTKHKAAAEKLLNYLAQPEVAAKVCTATGNVPALTNVKVDLGVLQQYIDKYSDVEAFNYFDRAYCPSGMWDVMCATGQDVLAQKSGAVAESAKQMKSTFDALWGN